jgi:hypothetical protein
MMSKKNSENQLIMKDETDKELEKRDKENDVLLEGAKVLSDRFKNFRYNVIDSLQELKFSEDTIKWQGRGLDRKMDRTVERVNMVDARMKM